MTDPAPARVTFVGVRGSVARPDVTGRAALEQPGLAAALLDALQTGARVELAGWRWRIEAAKHEDRWVSGRLASEDLTATEPHGVWSPFTADLHAARIAVQLRPVDLLPRTIAAAFRALLGRADPVHRWQVAEELTRIPWADWRRSVGTLRELRLSLRRPNPDYGDRHQVEALIEATNAELIQIVLNADPDSLAGIDVDAELVAEAIEHVQAGYGDFVAVAGTDGHGEVTSWQHRYGGTPLETQVPLGADSPEVEHEVLRRELERTETLPDRVPVPDRGEPDDDLEARDEREP